MHIFRDQRVLLSRWRRRGDADERIGDQELLFLQQRDIGDGQRRLCEQNDNARSVPGIYRILPDRFYQRAALRQLLEGSGELRCRAAALRHLAQSLSHEFFGGELISNAAAGAGNWGNK